MQSKRWSLRLDDETKRKLERLAKRQQRSMSNVIKVLIHEADQAEKEKKMRANAGTLDTHQAA